MTRLASLASILVSVFIGCTDSDQPTPVGPTCGDGVCSAGETSSTCPEDCGSGSGSGSGSSMACNNDGVCDSNESQATCPNDCDAFVTIENDSEWVVADVFIWPCGTQTIGNNQLASEIAVDGDAKVEHIPPACYNLGAVNDADTELWELDEQDLTAMQGGWVWTLTTATAQAPN